MNIYAIIAIVSGLMLAARARVTGVLLGMPVNLPVLYLAAALLGLIIAALMLYLLVRLVSSIESAMFLRARMVTT